GAIPAELGNLRALLILRLRDTGSKSIFRPGGNKLTGGPAKGEGLQSWKARMRRQQERNLQGDHKEANVPVPPPSLPPVVPSQQRETGEGENKEETAPVSLPVTTPVLLPQLQQQTVDGDDDEENAPVAALGAPTEREEMVGGQAASQGYASLSPEQAEVDRLFQEQLLSFAGVGSLIRQNPGAMMDIQRVLQAQVAGSFSPDHERGDFERRRKLGTLITMSTALGEVV
ncbi:unnamed protein product, partial [Ectocarpus fasciculatus]